MRKRSEVARSIRVMADCLKRLPAPLIKGKGEGENLAHLLGTSRIYVFPTETWVPLDFRIIAEVVSFEGVPGGYAVLKVRWALLDTYLERLLAVREDFYRCPVKIGAPAASGKTLSGKADQQAAAAAQSEAVVAAMSHCLGEFSRDVAQIIGTTPPAQPRAATVSPV